MLSAIRVWLATRDVQPGNERSTKGGALAPWEPPGYATALKVNCAYSHLRDYIGCRPNNCLVMCYPAFAFLS